MAAEPRVDPYLRAAVAFARMAESGIAATNHCHNTQDGRALVREATGVARAAADVGIRVAFCVPFAGRNPLVYGDDTALLTRLGCAPSVERELRRRRGRTLTEGFAAFDEIAALESEHFTVQYGPVGPQWVSDDALEAIARASADTGRRVHMHLFETERQRQWSDTHHGGGLVDRLDRIGLLSERLTVAHAVWLTDAEMARLAERGVSVALNPSSNLRLRSGLPMTTALRLHGVRFGVGLDGMSLDDDEDMLREIRLLRHLANAAHASDDLTAENLPMRAAFDAALVDGRRTLLGEDGGGCVAVGAPADLLVLDLASMARDVIAPNPDLDALLLARMSRRHVRRLLVGGRIVVDEGACVSVDLPALEAALTMQARAAFDARSATDPDATKRETEIANFYRHGSHLLP